MADASFARTSFLGGEWSKYAQGRFDRPDYVTALNECLNAIPLEQGAVTRRPGTQFLAAPRNGNMGRVIAFDIKQASPFLIEFTSQTLRFYQNAVLVTTNDDQVVVSISGASPAKVATTTAHGWGANGTVLAVKFANLGTSCPLLQNRVFAALVTSTTEFTLTDSITTLNIDGSVLGTPAVATTVQRILEVSSPYAGTQLQDVRMIQTEQAALLLHPAVPPQVLKAFPPGAGQTFYNFTLGAATFIDGPYFDALESGVFLTPSGTSGNITLTLLFPAYVSTRSYSVGDLVVSAGINYISLTDGNLDNIPASNPTDWMATSAGIAIGPNGFVGTDIGRLLRLFDGSNWTWGKIIQIQNLISATLAGSVNIGNMTSHGGLAAAFDSILSQSSVDGASALNETDDPSTAYVGKNYSGASAQKIDHGVLWPSNNRGVYNASFTYSQTTTTYVGRSNNCTLRWTSPVAQTFVIGDTVTGSSSGATGVITNVSNLGTAGALTLSTVQVNFQVQEGISSAHATGKVVEFTDNQTSNVWVQTGQTSANTTSDTSANDITIKLRAKATAPSDSSDGTKLGESAYDGGPTSVVSNDSTTTWNYVWFEIEVLGVNAPLPDNLDTRGFPSIGATGYTQTYAFVSRSINFFAAEAQFYNPSGTGSGNAVTFQILGKNLANTTPMDTWQLGVYSGTTGYPTCGTYHEGRLWLAGAVGNRADASESNAALTVTNGVISSELHFAPSSPGGQVTDNSAIAAIFNAPDVNSIFWMVPDALGIIAGTLAGDWLIQSTNNNNPITPTSIQAHRWSRMGCANIEPRRADHALIMVQRYGRKLFEYFADVFSGKFNAQNITWAVRHLTRAGIAEISYQHEAAPVIWARNNDGSLFGITYRRESNVSSQPPNFAGAFRVVLGNGQMVESIWVGPSADGTLDSLAMIAANTSNARHVQVMTPIFEESDALADAWFLDDAVRPTSTTSSSVTPAPYGGLTLNGLWHLNGATVTVFAGGLDCGDFLVTSGSLTVPYGDGVAAGTANGLFTADFAAANLGSIVAGFTYNTDVQIVRPASPQETGARNGPSLGKKRRSMQIAALLDNAVEISFGTDFSRLLPAIFKSANGAGYDYGQPFSGVYWTTLQDDYSFDSMICWRNTRPYPATMAAVEGFISTQDK